MVRDIGRMQSGRTSIDRLSQSKWAVALGAMIALTVSNPVIGSYCFGLFVKPISMEYGWKRGTVSLALALWNIGVIAALPFMGRMVDRWGVRRVLLPVIAAYALAVASMALAPGSITVFIIMYGMTGIVGAVQSPLPYAKVISIWFDKQRGLALGIAMMGIGLGVSIVSGIVQYVIDNHGWRYAFLVLGFLSFVVAFPSVALFVREPQLSSGGPASDNLHAPDSQGIPGQTPEEAFKSPIFWLIAAAFFLISMAVSGTTIHLVPFLTDKGYSSAMAIDMLAALGLWTIVGRIGGGILLDRIFAPYVAAVFFALPGITMILFVYGGGWLSLLIAISCLGLSLGCEVSILGFLASRYFGLRAYGGIYARIYIAFVAGSIVGPVATGYAFDTFNGYEEIQILSCAIILMAIICILPLGPYRFPALTEK